jgi:serine/threonine protein kinase
MDTVFKQRFEREIKVLSQLDHQNIVKIIQWNIEGNPPNFNPYYVMEYLSGGSLRQHMDAYCAGSYVRMGYLDTIYLSKLERVTKQKQTSPLSLAISIAYIPGITRVASPRLEVIGEKYPM